MADWDDVRRVATALPEVTEEAVHGHAGGLAWRVRDKTFLWERPLRRRDLEELQRGALGLDAPRLDAPGLDDLSAAPAGPVLAARVPDEGAKQALIASDPAVYFTIAHFDGFPAILVRLDRLDPAELDELATEAWLVRAPKRLAKQFLDGSTS